MKVISQFLGFLWQTDQKLNKSFGHMWAIRLSRMNSSSNNDNFFLSLRHLLIMIGYMQERYL